MATMDRARFAVLALLAAVAGTAAVGLAVLAQAGGAFCSHRVVLTVHQHATSAMSGMPAAADAGGVCPCILYAAAVAATLCLIALIALAGAKTGAPSVLMQAARFVAGLRLAPLSVGLGVAGAIPLAATLASDGVPAGWPALVVVAALVTGALLTALALSASARFVVTLARRLVVALAAAFRLLVPGDDAPWTPRRGPVLVTAGVRPARRRPSRAPPIRL
jgi:hypothetical protein